MAKKQTRRSISVRGTTYEALRDHCGDAGISLSDFVEQRIAEFFASKSSARTAVRSAAAAAPPAPRAPQPTEPERVAIARMKPPAATAPEEKSSAVRRERAAAAAAFRASAASSSSASGRPAPTPASQVIKARAGGTERNDYRGIRF